MRFELDRPALDEWLAGSDMREVRRLAAEAIVSRAEQNAPVTTGRYRDSLAIVEDGETIAAVSHDPFAHLVEFGSANNPPYRPITRAVEDVGLIFRDDAGG